MNPAVEEKLPKQRDEDKPQQKLHSTLKTNVKSFKQGIRSVMNANLLGKPTMGPIFKQEKQQQQQQEKSGPEESEDTEADETNLEDLATIPRVVQDEKEHATTLAESGSAVSERRPSIHKAQESRNLLHHDSPRGPQELGSSSGDNDATTAQENSLQVGSESNLPLPLNAAPLSPGTGHHQDERIHHPHSAPAFPSSPGLSPGKNLGKNNKFLRGKIKISALKNFVGAGLDLGNSSGSNNNTNNTTSAIGHMTARLSAGAVSVATAATTATAATVAAGETDAIDHARRRLEEPKEDEEFASPQMREGPGRMIAKKMRSSILGFKNLAKASRNAAVLLDDDNTESTNFDHRTEEDAKDVFDVADSDPSSGTDSPTGVRTIDEGIEYTASTLSAEAMEEKEEAKHRRREKHHHRRNRLQQQLESDSNHGPELNNETGSVAASSVSGPPLQRKKTKGKLDAQARERLKKHSEGRDFRNRTTTANRRRRQQLATKVSERHLETSDVLSDLPDLAPATPPSAIKPMVRPTLGQREHQHSSRKLSEPQSRRKHNKAEDDKLRERVRSRQSFVAAQGSKNDASFSVLDLVDKKEGDDDDDNDDNDQSFADEEEEGGAPTDEIGQASSTIYENSEESDNTGRMGESSAKQPGSNSSSAHGPEFQGNLQHVESPRSDDYLQLIISGSIPPKSSSPIPGETAAEPTAVPTSPKREKRIMARRASSRRVMDTSMDASESRRTKTASRAKGEKREPTSRRKPRGEKSSRHRNRSPRRKSDTTELRRRKAPPRNEAGHASEPVLSAMLETDRDGTSTVDHASEFENSTILDTTSRSHLDVSTSNMDVSSKTNEGGDERMETTSDHHDTLVQSNEDVNEDVGIEADPTTDPLGDSSRRESRRRHRKGPKEKRTDRKTPRSANGPSKHGASASASKPKLHRSGTRGRAESGSKKAPPSSRGRSEKPNRESKNNPERRKRRHSTDARKRPSNGSDADGHSVKPEVPTARELGNSLANIKW